MKERVALHNLGCKVNAYELEAMQQMLEEAGYEIVPFAPGADIYIINTCTVTNIADRKSRQMLHKAKKMNPDAIVVAAGCYVQAQGEKIAGDLSIDLVIGNNKKKDLIELLENYRREKAQNQNLIDINHTGEYEELEIERTAEHTRAYIKVQDGCNQFCTYCIIPYTRGRIRSRKKQDVLDEVERLAKKGYQEVVLTGIHLSSYGKDGQSGETLLSLIQAVHEVEGIRRIRLGSLEPGIVTEEFTAGIAALPKVCPHFHLSMQSGCDATLKRMNRRYTSAEYAAGCALLRKYYERPALTTDIIVGFPGETEEEFQTTREFVEAVDFYETHIFKYSRREGTKAAVMPQQIPEQVKTERSQCLLEINRRKKREFEDAFLQSETEVLFEEAVTRQGETWWTGHSREYLRIAVRSEEELTNRIRRVKLEKTADDGLVEARIL